MLIPINKEDDVKKSVVVLCATLLVFSFLGAANATLVGSWSFDENTGTKANDSSGYNNTGTVYGATWVPGKYGSALSFDGIDDYVNVSNSSTINLSTWTVSFWASLSDVDRTMVLLDKRNGDHDHNYEFIYYRDDSHPGEHLSANIGDGTPTGNDYDNAAVAPVALTTDQFYYFAATYDQSLLNLYLNGTLIASKAISMPGIIGDGDLHIGAHGITSMDPTFGIIDEVHIYNTALNFGQIQADMHRPVPEPATMLLLVSGLAGLVGLRRKFKR
jgi:hypothetical protein